MKYLQEFDGWFIASSKRYYGLIARVSLFIIFFLFGFLKLIGVSPASALALGFADKMGMGMFDHTLFYILAGIECLIGIAILLPRFTRPAILLMLLHMLLVSAPLILYPEAVWASPLVPNLEGQYIIKNAALVALALGLVANTEPLAKKSAKKSLKK